MPPERGRRPWSSPYRRTGPTVSSPQMTALPLWWLPAPESTALVYAEHRLSSTVSAWRVWYLWGTLLPGGAVPAVWSPHALPSRQRRPGRLPSAATRARCAASWSRQTAAATTLDAGAWIDGSLPLADLPVSAPVPCPLSASLIETEPAPYCATRGFETFAGEWRRWTGHDEPNHGADLR